MIRYIDTKEAQNGEPINEVRHPLNIGKLWSKAQLNKIGLEVYTPPVKEPEPIDPLTVPLTAIQFHAMLRIAGKRDSVYAAVNAIEDEMTKAIALEKLDRSQSFDRDDALFVKLAPVVGLTDEEIDALWVQAQAVS